MSKCRPLSRRASTYGDEPPELCTDTGKTTMLTDDSPAAPENLHVKEEPSPFRRALDEYVQSRRKKSKTPAFIKEIQRPGSLQTKEDVQKAMIDLDKSSTDRTSAKVARTTMKPVIRLLSDYSAVIDTLGMVAYLRKCA